MNRAILSAILSSDRTAWHPPGMTYSFTWRHSKSGTYRGEFYEKPAGLLVLVDPHRFLIQDLQGELKITYGAKSLLSPGEPLTDSGLLALLAAHVDLLLAHLGKSVTASPTSLEPASIRSFLDSMGITGKTADDAAAATQAAAANPGSYFAAHPETLNKRGIFRAQTGIYKLVLLDLLIDLGRAVELDHRCEPGEVARIAASFAARGESLVHWPIDSDSYPYLGVADGKLGTLLEASKKLGLALKLWKDLP